MRASLLAASPRSAQRATSAAACAWKPSDAWVKRQAELFDESKHDWTNDTLRTALLAAAGLTAPLGRPCSSACEIAGRAAELGPTADAMRDAAAQARATRGSTWPTRSVVGAAGTHAVYLLSRSRHRARRARRCTHDGSRPERVAGGGRGDVRGSHATDLGPQADLRHAVHDGRERQASCSSPMEDSAHADLRREDAGLPPFKLGLCLARQAK